MAYSGLLSLVILAVVGILVGMWSQRRGGGETEAAEAREEEVGAAAEAVEEAPAEGGIEPQLIAVMAAAIAAFKGERSYAPVRRPGPQVNLWVLSGRRELVEAVPPNLKWRSAR